MDMISTIFEFLALVLAVIGALVIMYGAIFATYHFILDLLHIRHEDARKLNVDHVRIEFGRNIVLGLEFFVAADIIQTVIVPDYYEIGLLGALVIIRTVLSFFLNKEIVKLAPVDRGKLR